ncbi:DUF3873 family protein [uncultured Bacteroides sp.]|uniref:DUF3873 family protein n=1 Tax=uncultured Bacteroides sp. TaxID=162156 RepID=UPI0025F589C4|nr:DUF3873 family protein [uncultured Bacteroides sp.]
MKTDKNGCTTCQSGKEQYEIFTVRGKKYVQYDYRTEAGELFACVKSTLEECRQKRDEWLSSRQ